MRKIVVALIALSSAACVVTSRPPSLPGSGPGPSNPPGNSSQGIDAARAEAIALKIARERRYTEVRTEKVHHDEGHGGRWKVKIRGLVGGKEGKLDVRISDVGEVLEVKDHQKGPKDDKDEKKHDKDKDEKKDK